MRLHPRCAVAPLFLASSAAAAARSAVLVAPLAPSESSVSAHLAPSDAALVIAQRLGLAQYHSVHAAAPETIEAINKFSLAPASSLFDNDRLSSKPSFMLVLDGVQDPQNFVKPSLSKHITIHNPPSSDSTFRFMRDLTTQHQSLHDLPPPHVDLDAGCDLDQSDGLAQCVRGSVDHRPVYHAKYLQTFAKDYGVNSKEYKAKSAHLATQLEQLFTDPLLPVDLTVLLTPFEESSWSFFGRSSPSQWTSPRATLARRQDINLDTTDPDATPQDLNPAQPQPAPQASAPNPTLTPAQSDSDPPAGILPFCYTSVDACKNSTNSCSGHGECKEKYTAKFGDGTESRTCYACACKAETRDTSGGGKKTTVWAGPACQKKDVSVPFWLLFGATVGLIGAVSFGLSTLYSMGNEELPSVLSAGVGGPHRSK